MDKKRLVTTGATWRYRSKCDCELKLTAMVSISIGAGNWDEGDAIFMWAYKAGVQHSLMDGVEAIASPASAIKLRLSGSSDIQVVSGQTIDVRIQNASGEQISTQGATTQTWVTISEVK